MWLLVLFELIIQFIVTKTIAEFSRYHFTVSKIWTSAEPIFNANWTQEGLMGLEQNLIRKVDQVGDILLQDLATCYSEIWSTR